MKVCQEKVNRIKKYNLEDLDINLSKFSYLYIFLKEKKVKLWKEEFIQ